MTHRRAHISLETKCAAALLALGHIDYEHAKQMSARQILSLYQFDHGVLHSLGGTDEPWNLTPRLIAEHRTKSRTDTSRVAKVRRLDTQWQEFTRTALGPRRKPKDAPKRKSKWPSRPFNRRKK